MLMYVDREESYDCYLVEIDQDSSSHDRERAVEVPDELVARYRKAVHEYGEVEELLREIWDRENA